MNEPAQWGLWVKHTLDRWRRSLYSSPHRTGSPESSWSSNGTSQLVGDVIFNNTIAGSAIQIRNFASSAGAVTVTPVPGGTQAQAVVLIIRTFNVEYIFFFHKRHKGKHTQEYI